MTTEHNKEHNLEYLRYDLDERVWTKRRQLRLPRGITRDFQVVVIQKRPNAYATGLDGFSPADFPTIVGVQDSNNIIYIRRLNATANRWSREGWFPLYGEHVPKEFFLNDRFKLVGLVQRTDDEFLVLIEKLFGQGIYYRSLFLNFSKRDDLKWRRVQNLNEYRGCLGMPLSRRIAVFSNQGAFMRYRTIRAAGTPDAVLRFSPNENFHKNVANATNTNSAVDLLTERDKRLLNYIRDFESTWMKQRIGVSLNDFDLSGLRVSLFTPTEDSEGLNVNPLNPGDPNVDTSDTNHEYFFDGTLLDLLTHTWNFNHHIPKDAHYQQGAYYLIQVIDAGVKKFTNMLNNINRKTYLDDKFGKWKLADYYLKQLSDQSGDSLAQLITRLSANRIRVYVSFLIQTNNDGINVPHFEAITFKERKGEELGQVQLMIGNWTLPPLSGDGVFPRGASAEQAIVLAQERITQATRLVRHGSQFKYNSNFPPIQITPDNDGPYGIVPLRTMQELQLLKKQIKSVYLVNSSAMIRASSAVQSLLKEAYNLVPIYLGIGLQRNGYYEEALLWFRRVFDFLQVKGKRKIDYSLRLEQELQLNFDDAAEWLKDSSNAHAIAATRKNTYTRHILLVIVRCLIDYANALFTNDNATDTARARELYTLALRLIDFSVLKPGKSKCADIIGKLEIEIEEPGQLPLKQFAVALNLIQDSHQLDSVIGRLKAINQDTSRPLVRRATDLRAEVSTALEAIPTPKPISDVLDANEQTARLAENYFLADKAARSLLKKNFQRRKQSHLTEVAEIAGVSEDILISEPVELPWLRLVRPQGEEDEEIGRLPEITSFEPDASHRLAKLAHVRDTLPMASLVATQNNGFTISNGVSFDFCIPRNPVIQSLRTQAETNLWKLRTCRNIAGFVRPMDPYGAPIGFGSGMVSPDGTIYTGNVEAPPTIYRYAALISKAKELVSIAQQIEAGYQTALERAEQEAFSVLQADNSIELAAARVNLQDLRVTQAFTQQALAIQQKTAAEYQERLYTSMLGAGIVDAEQGQMNAYKENIKTQGILDKIGLVEKVGATIGEIVKSAFGFGSGPSNSTATDLSYLSAKVAGKLNPGELFQKMQLELSIETRAFEWASKQGIAHQDILIAEQQINLADDGIAIAQQERAIAGIEQTQAADILEFLLNKFFNEETYRWIASVLEDAYRFFLQEACTIAQLAQRQLAFERQQGRIKLIQSNYWNASTEGSSMGSAGNIDRLGLTGSARLLKDIYQLDQYAFKTRRRKQALTITIDLADLFPVEFQRFRETGVLVFETPLSLVDRQMPGYYLCLIQQVSVSVVALIPPTYGIRATLTSAGTSRAVIGGDTFQTVTIRNLPGKIALTSPTTNSSIINLENDAQSFLNPFEGSGFDTRWELRMPKASNPWDYNTMATVLFTVNLTALHSFDYEHQVIEGLDRTVSFNRAFDFRQVFADPWYDLNNPDQNDTPMHVRFDTRREDFPPNLNRLAIQHVVLYVVRKDGELFEQEVQHLHFTAEGTSGVVGGPAVTVDGRVSTRSGNGTNWLPMLGLPPYGDWELAFSDGPPSDIVARSRFAEEQIENLLLVITVSGETATYVV